ncbi:hypothetical protein B1812_14310 [Methylocystis bryophila]|uniref:Uncharacterized protein n=1 Tax=Methylocystis bryophila TaxID=655015 RepID=A0A1W6MWY9_9HYPH|nr:hypothetical protein B1812_14310 [Methylocystis bryophila]
MLAVDRVTFVQAITPERSAISSASRSRTTRSKRTELQIKNSELVARLLALTPATTKRPALPRGAINMQ